METLISYLGVGGFTLVLISVFLEISPIKINPLQWLGNTMNKGIRESFTRVESKLDEHIAQSYRDTIFSAQDALLAGHLFTTERWREILSACDNYEKHVKENKIINGKSDLAIQYIKQQYTNCLNTNNFASIN